MDLDSDGASFHWDFSAKLFGVRRGLGLNTSGYLSSRKVTRYFGWADLGDWDILLQGLHTLSGASTIPKVLFRADMLRLE